MAGGTDENAAREAERVSMPEVAASAGAATRIPARVWAPILLAMAVLLCISAGFDLLTIVTPGSASETRWRFATVGAAAPKLLKVIVAVALVTLALAYTERRIFSYLFGVVFSAGAVVLLSAVPLFLLDALQIRLVLPSQLTGRVFVFNVSFTLGLLVAMSLVLFLCATMLFKVGRWLKLEQLAPEGLVARVWDG